MVVQKIHAVVQKMQVKPSSSSERYVLNKRPMGDRMLAEQRKHKENSHGKLRSMPWKAGIRHSLP